ncbi:hypothetical protein [Brevibacterium atlanticum]|uniref:hypothetical protein n=1 Tax=Brevibacterium atlanticum TaxID=2697563 RepID=UPI001420574A|nr:hypothetical protein [Brevibacterium atlanticum]
MRTGPSRDIRRPGFIVVVLSAVLILVALTGCDDNSPVAAPTSTLPEQEPDDDATDAGAEVDIPDYETDLDLSAEEKEAVDGALVAFVGYIETINRVFSSGGEDTNDDDKFAHGDSLQALRESANDLKKERQYMAGEYDFYDVRIHEVELDSESHKQRSVQILYCSHDSDHAVVNVGETMPSQKKRSLTILQTATLKDGDWKISNQELWSKKCE